MNKSLTTKHASFSPTVILARPDTVSRLAEAYFQDLQPTKPTEEEPNPLPPPPPTAAGLALHLGFSSTNIMLSAAADQSSRHPAESRHIILSALTTIENYLVQGGLTDRINVPLTKMILSAQHEIIPKKETLETHDATITFRVESHEPTSKEEGQEMKRLENILDQQTADELEYINGGDSNTTITREEPEFQSTTVEDLF